MADADHKRKGRRHKTHEQFVEEVAARNPKVEVIGRYEGSRERVEVRCRECGHVWEPIACNVLQGYGCPECAHRKVSGACRKTHEQFVEEVAAKNPKIEVVGRYVGSSHSIKVRCRACGHVWEPIADNIRFGSGCPRCKHRKLPASRRKTHEQFVADLAERNPNVEVLGRYENSKAHIKVRCRTCGHVWEPVAADVLHGSGCPECAHRKLSASRRKTHERFVEEVAVKNSNVEVVGRYRGFTRRIKVRCRKCGHVWTPVAGSVHNGIGCPKCHYRKLSVSSRKTHERFVSDLAAKNPKVEVIGRYEVSSKRIKVRCRECGHVWEPVANSVMQGSGCPECAHRKLSASRRKTHDQFVADLAAKNPNVEVIGRYEGSARRIKVRCRKCGHVWEPIANGILQGYGCPECAHRKVSGGWRKTHEQFVEEVAVRNPKVEVVGHYEGAARPVRVRCRKCGRVWTARPSNLLEGKACMICGGKGKKTHEQFVEEMSARNPRVEVLGRYEGSKVRIQVRCRECGREWKQTPNALLRGYACRACNRGGGGRRHLGLS